MTRIELVNLFLTKEALYRLSYMGVSSIGINVYSSKTPGKYTRGLQGNQPPNPPVTKSKQRLISINMQMLQFAILTKLFLEISLIGYKISYQTMSYPRLISFKNGTEAHWPRCLNVIVLMS